MGRPDTERRVGRLGRCRDRESVARIRYREPHSERTAGLGRPPRLDLENQPVASGHDVAASAHLSRLGEHSVDDRV